MEFRDFLEMAIDPYNITNWNRDQWDLEELILYSIISTGKTAWVQARSLAIFLNKEPAGRTPFERVRMMIDNGTLRENIRTCGLGPYDAITKGYTYAATQLDTGRLTVRELLKVHNISHKTARLIIMHAVPPERRDPEDQELAILDRHILNWIREQGHEDAPRDPPQSYRAYKKWELIYLDLKAKEQAERPDADFDLEIWRDRAVEPPEDWKTRPLTRGGQTYDQPFVTPNWRRIRRRRSDAS